MTELLPILMPQMGVSVADGTVTVWRKAEGDPVTANEPVCEVTTDKVDTEIVAPADGVLSSIVVGVGDTVAVGSPVAMMKAETTLVGAAGTKAPASVVAVDPGADADPAVPRVASVVVSSPVARRIAAEHGIELATIAGSGRDGRIRKADILAAITVRHAGGSTDERPTPTVRERTSRAGSPVTGGLPSNLPRGYNDVPHAIVATSPTRRAIAEHMVRSRRTAAHMTTEVEVDMLRVTTARAELNRMRIEEGQAKLGYLPFLARATCASLKEFPDLNATFDADRLIRWKEINLSIAVDTERGLLAPVIRRCNELTVGVIADRIADLAERARKGRLVPDDVRAGTFTISNPGSLGAVSAHAIINQPQVAILGVPAIVKRPTVILGPDGDDVLAVRPIVLLALTFDHRAVDGAEATRCALAIKGRLESWDASGYG